MTPALFLKEIDTVASLDDCRAAALAVLADALRASAAPMWREFADSVPQQAHAEARQFMDFLDVSFSRHGSEAFTRYLLWLRQVLVARHVHPDVLDGCLDELAKLFAARAPAHARAALLGLVREGQYALRWHQAPVLWRERTPARLTICNVFESALLAGDHARAQALFQEVLDTSANPTSAAIELVQPALYRIGRKWQDNQISVAQEHLATAIVQALLAGASTQGARRPANDQSALLALAPGNMHEVGLRIVADALDYAGWATRCLPAATTLRDIVEAVQAERPRVLAVSAALPQHLMSARALFSELRARCGARTPYLLLGGLAVNDYPDIARAAGGMILAPDVRSLGDALRALSKVA